MCTCAIVIFCAVLSVAYCADADFNQKAKLRFYHSSIDDYTELPLGRAREILLSSWFKPDRLTTIFCHGFTGKPNGPAVIAVTKAYLDQGLTNVALLNWDHLAALLFNTYSSSYLNYAVPNARKLGVEFADTLLSLSEAGMDLNKTHLVGHSLGAHIFGIAGNKLADINKQLPWITGLDPAGISFDSKPSQERLNPGSARFVDVIHSDPNKYGSKRSLGTVDFWPNFRNVGSVSQPGCEGRGGQRFSPEDLCNHNRCWQYLIDAMKYPGTLMGSHARNFRVWKRLRKAERLAVVLELGQNDYNAVPGNYYFYTDRSSPYGLGENGLLHVACEPSYKENDFYLEKVAIKQDIL